MLGAVQLSYSKEGCHVADMSCVLWKAIGLAKCIQATLGMREWAAIARMFCSGPGLFVGTIHSCGVFRE